MTRPRARDLGLPFAGAPGPHDAITDVPGVLVGHATLIEGSGPLRVGLGPVRTGVTAVLPRGRSRRMTPVWAGFHALNGNGEMTGTHWIRHGGYFHGPVCLTNTHAVGAVHDAVTGWMIAHHADDFRERHVWAMPVVAETYDGVLNDINGRHVRAAHALAALDAASDGPVAEGNVGGGTGMIAYGYKGGIGTASRTVPVAGARYTLGALVQANHGVREWLTVAGVPVGRLLPAAADDAFAIDGGGGGSGGDTGAAERGSIVVVIATDAPMLPHQLERVAARAAIGIGRHGTPGGNGSGDLFLAFSTANALTPAELEAPERCLRALADERFDPFYVATVQAIEEAVVNALLAAEDMPMLKPAGGLCRAIDGAALAALVRRGG